MDIRTRSLLVPALVLALGGCAAAGLGRKETARVPPGTAATVLRSEQLVRSPSLVHAIASRLPGAQVSSGGRACPQITLRGTKSIRGDNNPSVYVDGTRAANTCVLDMLQILDVERVEVYPSGIAPRPPYHGNPNGLILVFLSGGPTY
jgi:hypothetical protein